MAVQTETMKPPASPRKGRRNGVASELSVLLKVKPGREQQIREHMDREREDAVQDAEGRKILSDVRTLHEARYVLFDDDTRLLIATSFDGDWDVYIDDFFRTKILTYWSRFLIHCEGAPDDLAGAAKLSLDDWKEFLTAHQVTAAEYIRTYPNLTVKQILKAQQVMTAFQDLLDEASS
jgi:hypothetical protein